MTAIRTLQSLLCVALSALILAAAPAMAQEQELSPETVDLARRYVELTDSSSIFEVTLVQTGIETKRTLLPQNPELEEEIDTAIGETIKDYRSRKGELIDRIARIYAQRFTTEELQQIVDFYETDVGEKLVTVNREANRQIQSVLQVFRNNLNTEFLASVRATLREQGIDI